jgi:hypothetical protein
MNIIQEEKIIELLEMIVKQNEEIIKNQNIWRTFPTVPVPPSIDPHFGKDINMYGEVMPQYPFDTSS